jgi:hypothetical protein
VDKTADAAPPVQPRAPAATRTARRSGSPQKLAAKASKAAADKKAPLPGGTAPAKPSKSAANGKSPLPGASPTRKASTTAAKPKAPAASKKSFVKKR